MQIYVKSANLVILQSIPSCLSNIHHEKGWCDFKHLLSRYNDFNWGLIQKEKQIHITNNIYNKSKNENKLPPRPLKIVQPYLKKLFQSSSSRTLFLKNQWKKMKVSIITIHFHWDQYEKSLPSLKDQTSQQSCIGTSSLKSKV